MEGLHTFYDGASCLYGFQRRSDCRGIWPRAFGGLESSGPFFLDMPLSGKPGSGRQGVPEGNGRNERFIYDVPCHVSELVLVLQRLHLPRLLVELMNLIYRYIFILIDVSEQMQIAAKARLGYHSFRQSCKSFAQIAGNLFLVSLKKANAYYDALLSRGYDGKLEFLSEENPPAGGQLVFTGFYLIVLLAVAVIV